MTTDTVHPDLTAYPALASYLQQAGHVTPDPQRQDEVPPRPTRDPAVAAAAPAGARVREAAVHGMRVLLGHHEAQASVGPVDQTQQLRQVRPRAVVKPAPRVRVSPKSLRAALFAGAAAVTGMWGVQVQPSARLDALFATGAHLTGLLAGYGILVMLFLMARVPAVEHGIGADRLARRHALGGRWVLSLCFGHALLALCAYAAHGGIDLLTAAVRLLGYPGLAAAALGTALLAAVGVTSARAVRRRVPHETWRAVHLLTYLGAGLAFAHQLVGPDIAGSVLGAWAWAMMHATVAVLLVWYRLVVPVRQALRHSLRVLDVRKEGPDVVSVVMQGLELDELCAEPGQFFRWRFLQRRLWHTALPFSLSAPVKDDTLRITVKAIGNHTRRIRRLKPGTRVLATGPFGAMTAHKRKQRKVLLLAGGVGITPMRALFETLPGGPGDLTLLYRAGSAEQLVLREELESIAASRQAGLHYLLGRSDASFDPLAPQALRNLVPDLADHDVYLCGPPGMANAAIAALVRAGVPEERIHAENFSY
ncbi:ferredoxin reductase family protein [Streptomyces sp. NBC_01304]|uniref:ferredoxin reductase family protein n=1 Tax=Streptomyces sp. NBC_01304 TaxID=2903818 RepID=UPI002E0EDBAF|nr:ferric reductase-like transmembrane domain-containing protein [Streptomyces sp. NBC_01304]